MKLGFFSVLTLIFVTLKLTNVIAWSWWWVLSPLWLPWAVYGLVIVAWLLVAFVFVCIKIILDKR